MRQNFQQTRIASFLAIMFVAGLFGSTIATHPDANAQSSSRPNANQTANTTTDIQRVKRPIVSHKTKKIDGLDIFYREAGPKDAPTVLLLHGFPTSSH